MERERTHMESILSPKRRKGDQKTCKPSGGEGRTTTWSFENEKGVKLHCKEFFIGRFAPKGGPRFTHQLEDRITNDNPYFVQAVSIEKTIMYTYSGKPYTRIVATFPLYSPVDWDSLTDAQVLEIMNLYICAGFSDMRMSNVVVDQDGRFWIGDPKVTHQEDVASHFRFVECNKKEFARLVLATWNHRRGGKSDVEAFDLVLADKASIMATEVEGMISPMPSPARVLGDAINQGSGGLVGGSPDYDENSSSTAKKLFNEG